jgi:hypothetical protein
MENEKEIYNKISELDKKVSCLTLHVEYLREGWEELKKDLPKSFKLQEKIKNNRLILILLFSCIVGLFVRTIF